MTLSPSSALPSLEALKAQAKALRAQLQDTGTVINHAQSLELIARQWGFRNWNTLHARIGNHPPPQPFALGDRVTGRYLNQPFEGEIIGIRMIHGDQYQVTVSFEEPVDVVTFDSFSAFRQRVTAVVGRDGRSPKRTSDGTPHMQLKAVQK